MASRSGYQMEFMSNGEVRRSGAGSPDGYTLQLLETIQGMMQQKASNGELQRGQSSQNLSESTPAPVVALFGLDVSTLDSDMPRGSADEEIPDSQVYDYDPPHADEAQDSQAQDPVDDYEIPLTQAEDPIEENLPSSQASTKPSKKKKAKTTHGRKTKK